MNITLEEIREIERLLSLHKMTNHDIVSMENLSIKYIDSKIRICRHCSSQIRFAHKQLSMWRDRHYAALEEQRQKLEQEVKGESDNL